MRQASVSRTTGRHLVILGIDALAALALILFFDPAWVLAERAGEA